MPSLVMVLELIAGLNWIQ